MYGTATFTFIRQCFFGSVGRSGALIGPAGSQGRQLTAVRRRLE